MDKLEKLKVSELLEICKNKNIVIPKRSKKIDIINTLLQHKSFNTIEDTVEEDTVEDTVEEDTVEEDTVEDTVEEDTVEEDTVEDTVEDTIEDTVIGDEISKINEQLVKLTEIIQSLTDRIEKLENANIENIIDEGENIIIEKSDDNFDILKKKSNLNDTEIIDTLNEIYKMGIRFENLIDVNCYDTNFINYINERGYACEGVSLINNIDKCSITDIELSNYKDEAYDMVVCFNLFEYLTDNNIKTYYKNLLRITSNYIVIKINMNNTNETIQHYMDLFNNVVSDQEKFIVQRFVTKNLPKFLFILRKENINNE